MKFLRLTLDKEAFATMVQGLKDREYRWNKSSNWIKSRLIDSKTKLDKEYDYVVFVNGYGKGKPYFVVKYKGYEVSKQNYSVTYSNGFKVQVRKGTFRIRLGSVVKRGNINSLEMFSI